MPRVLHDIVGGSPQGLAGQTPATREGRHRAPGENSLRAAVLGANGGLTSYRALVIGVAGARLQTTAVLIPGLPRRRADAFLMASREGISVSRTASSTSARCEPRLPRSGPCPDEEREELELSYEGKGLLEEEALQVERLMADEQAALDATAREEIGLDPDTLGGFPYGGGGASFFLLLDRCHHPAAFVAAICCSAFGLFIIGALITLLTGRKVILSGTRQSCFGLVAAGVTFGLGRLIGTAVGGSRLLLKRLLTNRRRCAP